MSPVRKHLLVFGGWTFVALFFATHIALGSRAMGRPHSFWRAFATYETCALFWTAFTPLIIALSRRFRLVGTHALRNASVHFIASIVFSVAAFTLFIYVSPFTVNPRYADYPF
ncbi:MAG TPA: hypothetical protein VEU30_01540, partial [Thermoanaerobaculia bacterium]|nr:hypothetical protein [Thermoanaerobaculia bacterium]